jgi:hypothetical protein
MQIFLLVIQIFFFLFLEVHVDNEEPYVGNVDSLFKHSDNSWFDRYHALSLLLITLYVPGLRFIFIMIDHS